MYAANVIHADVLVRLVPVKRIDIDFVANVFHHAANITRSVLVSNQLSPANRIQINLIPSVGL